MFVPGMSGNPGGRPSERARLAACVRAEVGEHDLRLVVRTLVAIAGDPEAPAAARVGACSELLARGWGRVSRVPGADAERAAAELRELIKAAPAAHAAPPPTSAPDRALDALARLARTRAGSTL